MCGNNDKELYAKIVLILFKPFRTIQDLLKINSPSTNQNWWLAYKHYFFDAKSKVIIGNLQDYHNCRDTAVAKYDDSTSEPLLHSNFADNMPDYSDHYEAMVCDFSNNTNININKEIKNPVLFPSTGKYKFFIINCYI